MAQEKQGLLTLAAVGDVRPNRDDPPSVFRYCIDVFHGADLVFGQLESPLSDRGTPMFVPQSPGRRPLKTVSALNREGAGFDVMSFASNHCMHFGAEGLLDTISIARQNGIALVGVGKNIDDARKPAIIERKGTKIGFLAYNSI